MQKRLWPAAVAAAALIVGCVAAAGTATASPPTDDKPAPAERVPTDQAPAERTPAEQAGAEQAVDSGGRGTASPARIVDLRHVVASPGIARPAPVVAPLGQDGRPSTLPVRPGRGTKGAVGHAFTQRDVPNTDRSRDVTRRVSPTVVRANFDGVSQATSNCGGCQPSDVNAAVGATQITETVNTRLQVFNKAGTVLCGTSLNAFLSTGGPVSSPRIQYDNRFRRYVLVASTSPASATSAPRYFVAATVGDNACGRWRVYTVTFSGPLFPGGARLDFPYLGQDRGAILSSSNNFRGATYVGSAAWSIPKSAIYTGAGFDFAVFSVAFSTAPVTVAGIPTFATTNTYFLASVPGTGYRLYRMTNSAGPGTTLVLQANIASAFVAPTRRVNQPGTATTLDPLDGRIPADPVQDGPFVWFTHGIDLAGFPAIRYGAISTVTNTPFVATAFKSGTSDDFNPSIGVADAGGGNNRIWLNWAYTDPEVNVATSVTTNGVGPGEGVPDLVGGLDLVHGASTSTNTRFGDYSSVQVDPTAVSASCPAGRVAVLAQQFFGAGGAWQTRIARLGFC